jgi:hypothetical protein
MVMETWVEYSPGRAAMATTVVRRTILVLLLVTVLAAAWPSSAAGAQRESIRSAQAEEWVVPEFFNRLWSFLRGVEGKDGCHIDQFGRCAPTQSPEPQRKDGCRIDPFGRCLP